MKYSNCIKQTSPFVSCDVTSKYAIKSIIIERTQQQKEEGEKKTSSRLLNGYRLRQQINSKEWMSKKWNEMKCKTQKTKWKDTLNKKKKQPTRTNNPKLPFQWSRHTKSDLLNHIFSSFMVHSNYKTNDHYLSRQIIKKKYERLRVVRAYLCIQWKALSSNGIDFGSEKDEILVWIRTSALWYQYHANHRAKTPKKKHRP